MSFFEHVNHRTANAHDDESTYSYVDYVTGAVPSPKGYYEESLYRLFMVTGMTLIMVTFNTIIHTGVSSVYEYIWLYPLILCISLGMKFLFGYKVARYIAPRYINPHFDGFKRLVAMTLFNTAMMAPIMGFITSMLLAGPDGYLDRMANTLPYSMPVSVLVSLFVVGPFARMLHHKLVTSPIGCDVFRVTQRYVTNWAGVFTS